MRYAVIFKTYSWDPFVARQATRLAQACGAGDFFVSVDETNGSLRDIPFPRIARTSNDQLIASGLANRFEKGSLIWWNADYPHHQFYTEHGDYDYYVFVEYDVGVHVDLTAMITQVAAEGVDFVGHTLKMPMNQWFWTRYHRRLYPLSELRGTLNCLSVFSNRAMRLLRQRRMEMSQDPKVRYWPISEVFVATEIDRAGYRYRPLDDYGDTNSYYWYPGYLEDDLPKLARNAFIHPILDSRRYVALNLRANVSPMSFLRPTSTVRRNLARVPESLYMHALYAAALRRLRVVTIEQIERAWLRFHRTCVTVQHPTHALDRSTFPVGSTPS